MNSENGANQFMTLHGLTNAMCKLKWSHRTILGINYLPLATFCILETHIVTPIWVLLQIVTERKRGCISFLPCTCARKLVLLVQ